MTRKERKIRAARERQAMQKRWLHAALNYFHFQEDKPSAPELYELLELFSCRHKSESPSQSSEIELAWTELSKLAGEYDYRTPGLVYIKSLLREVSDESPTSSITVPRTDVVRVG